MSLKQALVNHLAEFDIAINPDISKRKVRPYILYQFISAEHVRHTTAGGGFCNRRVQFDVYADTAVEADTIMDSIRMRLDNFRGEMGEEGLNVLGVSMGSELDVYHNPEDATQVGKHRRTSDFLIWHEESIPDHAESS